jgi:hypothetical protein
MGIFMEMGALQGALVPDPDKPLTYESLVEQYLSRAKEVCVQKGWPEWKALALSEFWAQTDWEIFVLIMTQHPELTPKELLQGFRDD